MSTHAENEMRIQDEQKNTFLHQTVLSNIRISPWKASIIVGVGYLVGAAVPVTPFLFGATHALWSILFSGSLIILVSVFLAFLSGMSIKRRVMLNGCIITAAVGISYGLGLLLEQAS